MHRDWKRTLDVSDLGDFSECANLLNGCDNDKGDFLVSRALPSWTFDNYAEDRK